MAKEKATPETEAITQMGRMSIKKCGADAREAFKQNKPVFMGRILGVAEAYVTKENRDGEIYQYLIGQFRFTRFDGKQFESAKLTLPGSINELVETAVKAGNGKAVKFGYDITAIPDPESNVGGYAYSVKTVVKTAASDMLTELEKDLPPMPKKAA